METVDLRVLSREVAAMIVLIRIATCVERRPVMDRTFHRLRPSPRSINNCEKGRPASSKPAPDCLKSRGFGC